KICLSTLQVLSQSFLLSDIHPCAHESLQSPPLTSRNAHATDASNLSVRPHDSLREVECSMGRQGLLNLLLDEYPIFRIHQGQILFLCRRLASRIEPMDLKQLRRPILEPGRGKCPAACMGKPLSFREVELGLFAFVNVEINPDPIEQGSVRSPPPSALSTRKLTSPAQPVRKQSDQTLRASSRSSGCKRGMWESQSAPMTAPKRRR